MTTEPSGKVTTLAVEMPVGSVTAPELSEITVCPRELVVVTIPGIVGESGVVADELEGRLLLLGGGTTVVSFEVDCVVGMLLVTDVTQVVFVIVVCTVVTTGACDEVE